MSIFTLLAALVAGAIATSRKRSGLGYGAIAGAVVQVVLNLIEFVFAPSGSSLAAAASVATQGAIWGGGGGAAFGWLGGKVDITTPRFRRTRPGEKLLLRGVFTWHEADLHAVKNTTEMLGALGHPCLLVLTSSRLIVCTRTAFDGGGALLDNLFYRIVGT